MAFQRSTFHNAFSRKQLLTKSPFLFCNNRFEILTEYTVAIRGKVMQDDMHPDTQCQCDYGFRNL